MDFNKQQLEAINSIDGNIAVIATAGSGKTSTLIQRISNMVNNHNICPSSILAVTFSKKAKESIEEKLLQINVLDVNVETFHSLALKIIRDTYGFNYYKVWTAQWEKEKLLQDICGCGKDELPYNELMRFIATQKNNMVKNLDDLIYIPDMPYKSEEMQRIYREYEKHKEDYRLIEFDDFLNMANDILDDYRVLQKYQNKFSYILSDEYQDVSISQSLLLQKLNTDNLMIVGDPLQAIYSFRGGNSKFILNFDNDYDDAKIINLNTNYRCSKEIVETANTLARGIPDSKHRYYVESIAYNDSYKKPEYINFEDEYEEAAAIADKIKKSLGEYKYKDFAVLARTNAQLAKIQTVFQDEDIPFEVVNGTVFTESPEIKLLLSYLRLALNTNNNESFSYMYNKPNRWLDKKFFEETQNNAKKNHISLYDAMQTIDRRNWRFKNGINEINEVITYLHNRHFDTVKDMIHYLRSTLPIDSFVSKGKQSDDGGSTEQIENMDALENIAEKYSSLQAFIYNINKVNEIATENNDKKIQLSTIHKAKGLEFPVVFIVGCNDGLLPHKKSNNTYDEKRLFYVGITRAEKELYLSSTSMYNSQFNEPSEFLKDIKSTIIQREYKDMEQTIPYCNS